MAGLTARRGGLARGSGTSAIVSTAWGAGRANGRVRRRRHPSQSAVKSTATPPKTANGVHSGQRSTNPPCSSAALDKGGGPAVADVGRASSSDDIGVSKPPIALSTTPGAALPVTGRVTGRLDRAGVEVVGPGTVVLAAVGAGVGSAVAGAGKGKGSGRVPTGGGGIKPSGGPCTRPVGAGAGAGAGMITGAVAARQAGTANGPTTLVVISKRSKARGKRVAGTDLMDPI